MKLPKYGLLLWADGLRSAVEIILELNRYLSKELGEQFITNIYGSKRINLARSELEGFIERHRMYDGVFYTQLKASNGLKLSLTLDQPPDLDLSEVLVLSFDEDLLLGEEAPLGFEQLLNLFKFVIRLFEPFWGDVHDEKQVVTQQFQALRLKVDSAMVPDAIHWFNYFGPDMAKRLGGANRLLSSPVYLAEPIPETDGIILVLQRTTFDYGVEEHRLRQQMAEDYLKLRKLHQIYIR